MSWMARGRDVKSQTALAWLAPVDRDRRQPPAVHPSLWEYRCVAVEPIARDRWQRHALRLQYATIAWNVGEAVLTIGLGIAAASLALVGFGADSIIEVFVSLVVVWHLAPRHQAERQARSPLALRLVAGAFLTLAVVLGVTALRDLVIGRRPGVSLWGIAYLAITAIVMFALAAAKRRAALQLDSAPVQSEATMTFLDGILATATVGGLILNAALGWWWADPAAALFIAVAAANEARENWEEAELG